ncbi:hypothetical protein BG011_009901 [Mortierella polycephala]|uniref:Template-activating factor I n=1 Tax=Mortierella polycephala TaxID=41804 RepID=A0A9P6QA00_9FUNG|nr:hypothetical protein BG011_009901 [Mortierella polycephala]
MAEIDQAALEAVREDINALSEATEKVDLELTKKRNELMLPIFKKRRDVVAKIPKFWSTVCQNHHAVSQLISEADVPALDYLTDLWVEYDPKDHRNYELIFTFDENPYFSNKELVKKIVYKGDDGQVAESFEINWKEGKDLTAKDPKRKRNDDDDSDSFFTIFKDDDATVADFIAHDLFIEAFAHYLGEDQDFDEDDEDDDQSVDLDDEEDDEEEEEEPTKKKGKK